MTQVDWPAVATWLKSTVPGIIILGAIGSVIAVGVLKVASFFLRRLWNAALPRLIVANVRPFTTAAFHMHRFLLSGRPVQAIVYALSGVLALNVWLILCCVFGVGIVIVVRTASESLASIAVLSGAAGLCFFMLVRTFLNVAGISVMLFYRDVREISQLFKDPDLVMGLTDLIAKDLKAADAAAAAAVAEARAKKPTAETTAPVPAAPPPAGFPQTPPN